MWGRGGRGFGYGAGYGAGGYGGGGYGGGGYGGYGGRGYGGRGGSGTGRFSGGGMGLGSRGSFYKGKYGGGGGGGRGRGWAGGVGVAIDATAAARSGEPSPPGAEAAVPAAALAPRVRGGKLADLQQALLRVDGRGYGAYRDIEGSWVLEEGITLIVDRTQPDPFAPPSRCRIQVAQEQAGFPTSLFDSRIRGIALRDYLTRKFAEALSKSGADIRRGAARWGAAKGGEVTVEAPGQQVLERTSVLISEERVEARFMVALPAQGRTVLGKWASRVLTEMVPSAVKTALLYANLDAAEVESHVNCVEDTDSLRSQLSEANLVAFVGNGSILPRKSGASDLPMEGEEVVVFESPPSLARTFTLPHRGEVTGMGIPKGVTLIVGGGFHGKSTLLEALQMGVYNHVKGDGRELAVTDFSAVKIRAEDGRNVECVDISPFIRNLPHGRDTTRFTTADASGSTSQAANVMEALEMGAKTLLVDEDTCATNFMTRDVRMCALVSAEREPITPFVARIRSLVSRFDASCVLVIGGSGDYFDVADTVIMMDSFVAHDVTGEAINIAQRFRRPDAESFVASDEEDPFPEILARVPKVVYEGAFGRATMKSKSVIAIGEEEIQLPAVEQLSDKCQTRAIGDAIVMIRNKLLDGKRSISEIMKMLEVEMDAQGLDALSPGMFYGYYARPRALEIAAALNRLRTLKIRRQEDLEREVENGEEEEQKEKPQEGQEEEQEEKGEAEKEQQQEGILKEEEEEGKEGMGADGTAEDTEMVRQADGVEEVAEQATGELEKGEKDHEVEGVQEAEGEGPHHDGDMEVLQGGEHGEEEDEPNFEVNHDGVNGEAKDTGPIGVSAAGEDEPEMEEGGKEAALAKEETFDDDGEAEEMAVEEDGGQAELSEAKEEKDNMTQQAESQQETRGAKDEGREGNVGVASPIRRSTRLKRPRDESGNDTAVNRRAKERLVSGSDRSAEEAKEAS